MSQLRTFEDGNRKERDLKKRTKRFALDVISFVATLPGNETCRIIGRQLIKCGTSVGANYRSACRARSKPDFVNKLGFCEEESDESAFWFELLIESGLVDSPFAHQLLQESTELTAIMSASRVTARRGL